MIDVSLNREWQRCDVKYNGGAANESACVNGGSASGRSRLKKMLEDEDRKCRQGAGQRVSSSMQWHHVSTDCRGSVRVNQTESSLLFNS